MWVWFMCGMWVWFVCVDERDAFDKLFDEAPEKLNQVKRVSLSVHVCTSLWR